MHYDQTQSKKTRLRSIYSCHEPIPCYANLQQWQRWFFLREGTQIPCVDCTPEYQRAMFIQKRCSHPEIIFINIDGELTGLTAPDERYVHVIKNRLPDGWTIEGRKFERNRLWGKLLFQAREKAHPLVKQAIDLYLEGEL